MLTRLKVSGFKNLHDVDVYFGPFTCIAGTNGVGKSNLFDAITFLSALADRPLLEAALSIRDEGAGTGDVQSLFRRVGQTYVDHMSFEAEMIVPQTGTDELGQQVQATVTFLRYSLTLAFRSDAAQRSLGGLEIIREELVHINADDAHNHLFFDHAHEWRTSAVVGSHAAPFISTEGEGMQRVIRLHQDGAISPVERRAVSLPRTILSVASTGESPTVLLARREMQSWQLYQLEPTALRQGDAFTAPTRLGRNGSHLAATLYALAQSSPQEPNEPSDAAALRVYWHITNRLFELVNDVYEVSIDRDENRRTLTLQVTDRTGTTYPARVLSDGTLRFLALCVLALAQEAGGILCLEEPENGIPPRQIPAVLRLLEDTAIDVTLPVTPDNPLRQVIITTHSSIVVSIVPEHSLLVAELRQTVVDQQRFTRATFSGLPATWRQRTPQAGYPVAKGTLLAYLYAVSSPDEPQHHNEAEDLDGSGSRPHGRRVIDRPEFQLPRPTVSQIE